MALPNSIDASSPAAGDSPSLGDDQLRALKLFIEDIFSIPDATSITNAGIDYQTDGTIRYPRRQELGKGSDIASASAVTVGLDGNYFDLTGVATVTSFSSVQAGAVVIWQFDDACTITHNATSMILANAADQAWAAGDILSLISEGGGNWRELWRKGPLAGRTLAIIGASTIASSTGNVTLAQTSGTFGAGLVGIRITPVVELHVFGDNTTFRLQQATGSGLTARTWDYGLADNGDLTITDVTAGTIRLTIPGAGGAILFNSTPTVSGNNVALVSDNLSVFAATTSAQLRGVISDETGSGALVFATSPTLVTPLLGTPTSGVLTNCTGLPQASVVGLTTADSPQFAGLNIGHASDTTITRVSAGVIAVEGNNVALVSNNLSVFAATTSAQLAGVISDETGSGALVFATAPTLSTGALVTMGTGSGTATVVGVANVNTTSQATTGTVKETLASYSLPANSLSANGKAVRVRAWGITASNGNAKTFGIDFGATTVATTGARAANGETMFVEATIIRTSSGNQEAVGLAGYSNAGGGPTSENFFPSVRTTPAETETGAITIAITGTTPTASGDLTFKGMTVEFLN